MTPAPARHVRVRVVADELELDDGRGFAVAGVILKLPADEAARYEARGLVVRLEPSNGNGARTA
jgi:hypothetical protein